jgi:phage major head subunit gpT-like protein
MFYEFNLAFQEGLTTADVWHDKLSTTVPSGGESITYPLLDKVPRLRKWLPSQDRTAQNASLRSYSLTNDDYELTVEVDRNKIEDDMWGAFTPLMRMMGEQAARWPGDMLASAIQAGASNACYDAKNFFATDHPVNIDGTISGTQSNYSASGLSLTAANYTTTRGVMASYLGADGKPLGLNPDLLVVPPQLEMNGRQILNSEFIAPAAGFGTNTTGIQTNVLRGSADLLVIPQLSNESTTWYLMVVNLPIKPFVFQQRKAPVFVQYIDPSSPHVFNRRKFVYGCDARGAAGYTIPFLCYRATA